MPFTALTDLATGDLVTEAEYDKIRENFDYMLLPNGDLILHSEGGTYSITNVTTFQDIDGTDLSIDVTTYGGRLLLIFECHISATGLAYFDFSVDGTRIGASFTAGLAATFAAGSQHLTMTALYEGPADTYTIRPQWRTSGANTATLDSSSTFSTRLYAVEIF